MNENLNILYIFRLKGILIGSFGVAPNFNAPVQFHASSSTVLLEVAAQKSPNGSPQYLIERCHLKQDQIANVTIETVGTQLPSDLKKTLEVF